MTRACRREFGLPYTIFRFFDTFGPRQSEDFVTRTSCFIDDDIDAAIHALETGGAESTRARPARPATGQLVDG